MAQEDKFVSSPAVPSAPDPQMRALASAMRKLLPPILFAQVLGYLDPLGEFEKFLKSEPASAPDPQGWQLPELIQNSIEALLKDAQEQDAATEHDQRENWRFGHIHSIAIYFGIPLPAAPQVAEPQEQP